MTIRELKNMSSASVMKDPKGKNFIYLKFVVLPSIIYGILVSLIGILLGGSSIAILIGSLLLIPLFIFESAFYNYCGSIVADNPNRQGQAKANTRIVNILILCPIAIELIVSLVDGLSPTIFVTGILYIFLSILAIPITSVVVLRNCSVFQGFEIGIKLGFKYFSTYLKLVISFIPLYILIGITFGIVGIFKKTYIETTYLTLAEQLLKQEKL